ncbi:MAG: FAD-binding protein, partial [Ignavibacteriae bacterium]
MQRRVELSLSPSHAADPIIVKQMTAKQAGIVVDSIRSLRLVRRSIDARGRKPLVRLAVDVFVGEDPPVATPLVKSLKPAKADRRVVIIGAGPAGYFAALELLKYGVTPIVLDRGKDVRERRRDLRAIQQDGVVDPDSNYCFGEGGAGTYSDGKLYTRSHKRGDVDKVLHLLVEHGANPDILIDAHPHIGSNKLWTVVQAIRETIQRLGGEVHFHSRVVDFVIDHAPTKKITGVVLENGDLVEGQAVILATGHSARDIF